MRFIGVDLVSLSLAPGGAMGVSMPTVGHATSRCLRHGKHGSTRVSALGGRHDRRGPVRRNGVVNIAWYELRAYAHNTAVLAMLRREPDGSHSGLVGAQVTCGIRRSLSSSLTNLPARRSVLEAVGGLDDDGDPAHPTTADLARGAQKCTILHTTSSFLPPRLD